MKILRRQASHDGFRFLIHAGILEVLFPRLEEVRLAHAESKTRAADAILQHLTVLEDLRAKGYEPPDYLLLATLTAAPVRELFETLPPDHDVGKSLHEYLEANFKPLAFPRIVRAKVHLLHLALRHMLAEQRKKRRSLRRSPIFADALKLLEIHCLATNHYWSVLRRWQTPSVDGRHHRRKNRG